MLKHSLLSVIVGIILYVLIVPSVFAFPLSEQLSCPNSQAAKPCTRRWIEVDVYKGYGLRKACIDLGDNPLGYYKKYTKYAGWMYIDANGVTFYSWYNDSKKGAVVGPLKVVKRQSWKECGIPW